MVSSSGQMEDATEENGVMGNKTAKEPTFQVQDRKSMENGSKEKESDGLDVASNKINE